MVLGGADRRNLRGTVIGFPYMPSARQKLRSILVQANLIEARHAAHNQEHQR
jgi:hypothetical protein